MPDPVGSRHRRKGDGEEGSASEGARAGEGERGFSRVKGWGRLCYLGVWDIGIRSKERHGVVFMEVERVERSGGNVGKARIILATPKAGWRVQRSVCTYIFNHL